MSFKREGDDASQLNVLKKRRAADLLASFIPEDEALLLKNGRYACTVCFHRPVFDTIDMLSVHRSGKKHTAGLQKFYGKKEAYRNEVQKRQHQKFVQAEEAGEQPPSGPAPLLTQTRKITQHALLKATPYNSCCSRNRSDAVGRKVGTFGARASPLLVNLPQHTQQGPLQEHNLSAPHTMSGLPGHSELPAGVREQNVKGKKSRNHRDSGAGSSRDGGSSDPDRTRAMEHYLILKSSGWIPDGTGKWVKDQNVEFDSDEEEPPAFLPP